MVITPSTGPLCSESSGTDAKFPGIRPQSYRVEDLLDRITREDDYSAFEALFNLMYPRLCQFCLRFVRVREVAEELVSDVFYTIWKNRQRIEVTSHQSYLFTAVRNRGFDYLRRTKKTTWCDLDEAGHIAADHPDSHEVMAECELSDSLQRGIAELPTQCRIIFEMSRGEGLKYREIASALNLSVKTVETQMGRALKRLQRSIPSV